jgi:cephalosporin hydroxylase
MSVDDLDIFIDIEASVDAMHRGCILLDVPAMKGIEDLHRYEVVVKKTRPDLIIQTGTAVGGSAMWFARDWVTFEGPRVVTIDIDPGPIDQRVWTNDKIEVLIGSSIEPQVIESVRRIAAGYSRVMVILDSDHSAEHVRREIGIYGPLVSSGCYLVVEDGIYDFAGPGEFNPGPFAAIKSTLVGDPEWRRDADLEAAEKISLYPAGWWIKQ